MKTWTFDKRYQLLYGEPVTPHLYNPTYGGSQIYDEFNDCWNYLISIIKDKDLSKVSFLEIGAYKGLWGLRLLHETVNLNIQSEYHTVTLMDDDSGNDKLLRVQNLHKSYDDHSMLLVNNDSTDPKNLEKLNKKYNFVFIDANHEYDYVMKDIELYSNLATEALIFHDIRPRGVTKNCGVYQAIVDSGLMLSKEFVERGDIMGIGIVDL